MTNAGGAGALTVANGILVVQAINGATTSATAFTLAKPVNAGAYTYYPLQGWCQRGHRGRLVLALESDTATTATTAHHRHRHRHHRARHHRARHHRPRRQAQPHRSIQPHQQARLHLPPSTPLYRMEVPIYAEIPVLTRELGIEQIGDFHDRQGDQALLNESGIVPASWTRAWGSHTTLESSGGVAPQFSGSTGGLQIGQDVYADTTASGHRKPLWVPAGLCPRRRRHQRLRARRARPAGRVISRSTPTASASTGHTSAGVAGTPIPS